jgi:4-hydroxybenzoate polyprenyltransferase
VSNLPTVWTNTLCAVILSGGSLLSMPTLGALVGLSLIYAAGMCLNDLMDLSEDRVRKPGRPLPSRRIGLGSAITLMMTLFASALVVLGAISPGALLWGAVLCGVVLLYDSLHRKHAATVLLMAACRALVFPVAARAANGQPTRAVVVAGAAQFLYVIALALIARWEKTRTRAPLIPVPWLLAGIALVDGALLAVLAHPGWLVLGIAGAVTTRFAQRWVPGD